MARESQSIPPNQSKPHLKKNEDLNIEVIDSVINHLLNYYQLDFSGYAKASLSRRIEHLITIFGLLDADELLVKIKEEPDFKISLVHEITVGATEMFRDPPFWIALKNEIIPKISNSDKLKIWIAGCSTGEEIFSLAILLKEAEIFDKVEILATDLDPLVIDAARKGYYFNHSFVKNSENYVHSQGNKTLDFYCKKGGLGYQMDLSLLENVRFKCHDLVQQSIEATFDIIFCRNVLIYFDQKLQNQTLKKIRQNLREGSYLGLGVKESIMWLKESNQFEAIKRYEKIYKVKPNGENT
ncbi:MAG: protein-glutamate O-methyltransferase CheR [Cytophagales bacterium]